MENQYFTWDEFIDNYQREYDVSVEVFDRMAKSGLKDFTICKFDFHFLSDDIAKLEALSDFLVSHYSYVLKPIELFEEGIWDLSGETDSFPVTREILRYWALDMYKRGYEFDSILDGYGALVDTANSKIYHLDNLSPKTHYDKAIEYYNSGNLSAAITHLIIENIYKDQNAATYFTLAVIKAELLANESAMNDYNKALELAPEFTEALLNRGALKDELGDYEGAIQDYCIVITRDTSELDQKQMAYFNRGNTYLNLDDIENACKDWHQAYDLGAVYALERIKSHCK